MVQWAQAPIATVRLWLRWAVFVIPVLTAAVTYWITRALRRSDRATVLKLGLEDLFAKRPSGSGRDPREEDLPTQSPPHRREHDRAQRPR